MPVRLTLLMAVVGALSACGTGNSSSQMVATDRVSMTQDQLFDPEGATVEVGATVTFENTSAEAHTVTAYQSEIPSGADYFASGGADSEVEARGELADGLLAEGESYEVTFSEPGTYRYFCIPHEGAGMKGTIVVEE